MSLAEKREDIEKAIADHKPILDGSPEDGKAVECTKRAVEKIFCKIAQVAKNIESLEGARKEWEGVSRLAISNLSSLVCMENKQLQLLCLEIQQAPTKEELERLVSKHRTRLDESNAPAIGGCIATKKKDLAKLDQPPGPKEPRVEHKSSPLKKDECKEKKNPDDLDEDLNELIENGRLGKIKNAVKLFQTFQLCHRGNYVSDIHRAKAANAVGLAYKYDGKCRDARKWFKRAVELNGNDSAYFYNRGYCILHATPSYSKLAYEMFSRAIEIEPERARKSRVERARLALKMGKHKVSKDDYEFILTWQGDEWKKYREEAEREICKINKILAKRKDASFKLKYFDVYNCRAD